MDGRVEGWTNGWTDGRPYQRELHCEVFTLWGSNFDTVGLNFSLVIIVLMGLALDACIQQHCGLLMDAGTNLHCGLLLDSYKE